MIYIVDIDGTICKQEIESDYTTSYPLRCRIEKINDLFDQGHTIIYWTARGMRSNKDWSELTKTQLTDWNCKYHDLKMNKPMYDVWIDDKAKWIFE